MVEERKDENGRTIIDVGGYVYFCDMVLTVNGKKYFYVNSEGSWFNEDERSFSSGMPTYGNKLVQCSNSLNILCQYLEKENEYDFEDESEPEY